MRKTILLMCIAIISFCACSKTEEDTTNTDNILCGTTWTRTTSGSNQMTVLCFSSNTQCEAYYADLQGNYLNGSTHGTYSLNGNNITFNNLALTYTITDRFKSGTISGNLLTTENEVQYNTGGSTFSHTYTWSKKL